MAVLLAKFNHMEMAMPGGCEIGTRPIDQTLKAFRLLGAEIIEEDEKIIIRADKLVGNQIDLDMPSVGATINAILVAVRANGKTVIKTSQKKWTVSLSKKLALRKRCLNQSLVEASSLRCCY